jgi:hypothetical protein
MPLLNKREYEKKMPWRDATIFIIVCEGSHKEPEYFNFFHLLTKSIKVIAVPSSEGRSSPTHLIPNAHQAIEKHNSDDGDFELWFVIDVDQWKGQIHELQQEALQKGWNVAISNPCFEVWLNDHFESSLPPAENEESCKSWKAHVHQQHGGFDHTKHQTYLARAIENARAKFSENGYIPDIGKTQVFRLGERILKLTEGELKKYYNV